MSNVLNIWPTPTLPVGIEDLLKTSGVEYE